jgi:hypothetical protein
LSDSVFGFGGDSFLLREAEVTTRRSNRFSETESRYIVLAGKMSILLLNFSDAFFG